MPGNLERKIVLVCRDTRLDELLKRFNTRSQVQFYLEHQGDDYRDYFDEHDQYYRGLNHCRSILGQFGRVQLLNRNFLPNYVFGPDDLIVVFGQDGLVCNTLKYLNRLPVIAVNPDPKRFDGVLLPFRLNDLQRIVEECMHRQRRSTEVTMAEVRLNSGERLLAVNDLFIGPRTHSSARYILEVQDRREEQSSSGIIISTGMGSTGWLKSLYAGALGIAAALSSRSSLENVPESKFPWNAEMLCFTVREPFSSRTSQAQLVFGKIQSGEKLKIISRMAGSGVIFSDGIESDFLAFNSGTEAEIQLASERGLLIQ